MINKAVKNLFFLPLFIPLAYLLGSFFLNLVVSLTAIMFVIYILKFSLKLNLSKYFIISFICFYFLLIISSLNSDYNTLSSLERSLPYIRYLFFTFGSVLFFKNTNNYKIFNSMMFYLIILLFLFAVFQSITNLNLLLYENQSNFRLTTLIEDELILGSQFLLFISIYLFFINDKRYSSKILMNIFIFFGLILILRSGERMVFFKYILTLILFYFFIYSDKSKFKIILATSICVLSIALIYKNQNFYDRFYTNFFIEKFTPNVNSIIETKKINGNYNNRFVNQTIDSFLRTGHGTLFLTSIEIFKNNILLGVGTKQFRNACSDYAFVQKKYFTTNSVCSTHPHNFYLEILSENGIFGFVSFAFIILFTYISPKISNYNRFISFIPILIFLWPFASTGSLFTSLNSGIFWFLISLYIVNTDKFKKFNL